jgi:hypothetical protein
VRAALSARTTRDVVKPLTTVNNDLLFMGGL